MNKRRLLLVGVAGTGLAAPLAIFAQPSASAEEQKLRERLRSYVQAWNSHDANAWSAFLTDDIWFTEAWDYYGRQKGRDSAVGLFKSNYAESELTQEVVKVRMMPDGTGTVVTREVVSHLPKTDGKYKAVFESDPVISRWRKEGDVWKMFFYTSHKGWALDQMKKDGVE